LNRPRPSGPGSPGGLPRARHSDRPDFSPASWGLTFQSVEDPRAARLFARGALSSLRTPAQDLSIRELTFQPSASKSRPLFDIPLASPRLRQSFAGPACSWPCAGCTCRARFRRSAARSRNPSRGGWAEFCPKWSRAHGPLSAHCRRQVWTWRPRYLAALWWPWWAAPSHLANRFAGCQAFAAWLDEIRR
jgi:hypothetical protein